MARQPKAYNDIHRAADRIEPRMARAFVRASDRLRDTVTIDELALAIASGSVLRAMRLFPAGVVREKMAPLGTIAKDAMVRGGRIGAAAVPGESK